MSDTAPGERRVEVHPDRYAIVDFDPSLTFECVEDDVLLEPAAHERSTE